jgi:putative Mg2+ transporter-C (MgtC) family protein
MWTLQAGGQGAKQFLELGFAFLLSAAIGLEREIRHKSAGLRTYTVIGTTAALFLLISKYGFTDVLITDRIVLDPSRVAAQIVTGIGFIGAVPQKNSEFPLPPSAALSLILNKIFKCC